MRKALPILRQIGQKREEHEPADEVERIIKAKRTKAAVARLGTFNFAKTINARRTYIFGLPK